MVTEKMDPDLIVTFQHLSSGSRITDSVNLGSGPPKDVEIDFFLGNESLLGTAHVTFDEVLEAVKLARSLRSKRADIALDCLTRMLKGDPVGADG